MKGIRKVATIVLSLMTVGASSMGLIGCGIIENYLSNIPNSEENFVSEGIGRAVNLLTGDYTKIANGTVSIFDEEAFKALDFRVDDNVKEQKTTVAYGKDLQSYLDEKSTQVTNKMSTDVSIGLSKIAKVSLGYELEVNETYKTRTSSATETAFYDMDYYYINKLVEIDGYNDLEKLSAIVTERFKMDAMKVEEGIMSAAAFINLYGTHILTSGIYGATFNLHYEMIGHKQEVEKTFTRINKETINAGISGVIKGIDLGLNTSTSSEIKNTRLENRNSSSMQAKFDVLARGGAAAPAATLNDANSLVSFGTNCTKWAETLDEGNYVLIDVPDNSLYFVWEFLGDEYIEAKKKLYDYFNQTCELKRSVLGEKINGYYSHFVTFEENTGILTVDFSELQTADGADNLKGFIYDNDTDGSGVDFNDKTADNIFKIYRKINYKDVNKVIFKGRYGVENSSGQPIKSKFNGLKIYFDENWDKDILLEFDHFGYIAPQDMVALDLSAVQSKNITIKVVGNAYIKGGDGFFGCAAINAVGKNLAITGDNLETYDGNILSYYWNTGEREQHINQSGWEEKWYIGLNAETLKAAGYTKFKIKVEIDGHYDTGDWFRASWYYDIYDKYGEKIQQQKDKWSNGKDWDSKTYTYTLSLDAIGSDGKILIKYNHEGDNADRWSLGTVDVWVTAVE